MLKAIGLWAPAILVWVSLAYGAPLLDFRTDEEINEDENEARRLERFFDVEGLGEVEYLAEWTAKEEALSQIVDKLLRAPRFTEAIARGPSGEAGGTSWDHNGADGGHSEVRKGGGAAGSGSQEPLEASVEISYVLPPPDGHNGGSYGYGAGANDRGALSLQQRPWGPRLVVAHREGGLALVALRLEHVEKGRDREARWACTLLTCDLINSATGQPGCERVCDLRGPAPHGVRYMRI